MANDRIPRCPTLAGALDLHRYEGRDDAEAIRRALRSGQYDGVKVDCFNEEDRDRIASHLTSEERARVYFTWPTFPGPRTPRLPR